ncbi:hypothetical protein L9F63_012760 [Diploptera punctata]|uniref:C2H2-type domain-containing protein n=1 Tax=Diploptera punctata TaxID=6984 RepID=A0AAD8ACU4_DIPPU|nr:hypothetical protein L9F63_012760 [Diploptera punctata]
MNRHCSTEQDGHLLSNLNESEQQDVKWKIHSQDLQFENVIIKDEICPSLDPLAFEDTKLEVNEEKFNSVKYFQNYDLRTGLIEDEAEGNEIVQEDKQTVAIEEDQTGENPSLFVSTDSCLKYNKVSTLECNLCNRSSPLSSLLIYRYINGEEKYTCTFCCESLARDNISNLQNYTDSSPEICNESSQVSSIQNMCSDVIDKNVNCRICNRSYSEIDNQPIRNYNTKSNICDFCKIAFSKKNFVSGQESMCINKIPNKCYETSTGNTSFTLDEELNSNKKSYMCKFCKKIFHKKGHLNRHKRFHKNERRYSCNTCRQTFIEKHHLVCHLRVHTYYKPYICNVCKKAFNQKSNLTRHERLHSNIRPYRCNLCNRSFIEKHHLVCHIRVHTNYKPFTCKICKKSFYQKSHLSLHERLHTNERPYTCNFCDLSFIDKSHLSYHIRVHAKVKPFRCNFCEKSYTQRGTLTVHERLHTNYRQFTCNVCEKSFNQKTHLASHRCLETVERPYTCAICKISFNEKGDYTNHMHTHTTRSQFICEFCNKSFAYRGNLTRHVQLKHE